MSNYVTVELELLSGKRIIEQFDSEKVYCIAEHRHKRIRFKKKFPFFYFVPETYSSFKYRTHYSYINCISDPKFKVNCDLNSLMELLEIKFKPFSETVLKSVSWNG